MFRNVPRKQGQKTPKPNRDPLRAIIGHDMVELTPGGTRVPHEIPECGHAQLTVEDSIGKTIVKRRRCWQCGALEKAKSDE